MFNPKPKGGFETTVISLERAQNLLLIKARVNNIEGNFILDTGAPCLVLNKAYFKHEAQSDEIQWAGITGGSNMVYTKRVDRLEIQDLFYENLTANVVDLHHIEESKGMKILGLLGANLFAEMEMEIDVANNLLYLRKLNQKGDRLDNQLDTVLSESALQIPIDLVNNLVFINASVQQNKLRFCLDTGAEISVLSNATSKKVLQSFQLKTRRTLLGPGNKRAEVQGGELDELLIGNHLFSKMQALLTGLGGLQSVYNTTIQGILGYNFLAEGRVVINFKKRTLRMFF
jgi:predicted aspartyl protease